MTDYIPITETETNPGAPSKSSLWKRWAKNWIAGFEGALGAPRFLGEAVARIGNGLAVMAVTAADTVVLDYGLGGVPGNLVASQTMLTAQTWTSILYTGVIRFKITHNKQGGVSGSSVSLYKNGVIFSSFSGGTTAAVRSSDVPIVPGDVIEWRHNSTGVSGSLCANPIAAANDGYIPIFPYIKASAV
jgi:hypothetical protein